MNFCHFFCTFVLQNIFDMLLYFKIKNSRSFDEKGIHFSLLATETCKDAEGNENLPEHLIALPKYNVNVLKTAAICGANASGKSNVIKCLFDMRRIINYSFTGQFYQDEQLQNFLTDEFSERILGKKSVLPYYPNKNDRKNIGKPTTYTLGLLIENTHFEYSFSYNHERILTEYLLEYPDNETEISHFYREYNEKTNKYTYKKLSAIFEKKDVQQSITKGSSLFLSAIHQFAENDTYKIDLVEKIFSAMQKIKITPDGGADLGISLYYLQKEDLLDKLKTALQNADFLLSNIEPTFEEKKGIFDVELKKITSFHKDVDFNFVIEESDGTKAFVAWFGYIWSFLDKGETLFIDEFGTYMHPLLTRYFINLYYEKNPNNAQLIITTHDIKLMDRRYTRDDQVFLMERSDEGNSELKRLSDYEIDDKYVILDNLYLQGAFGAIPNIKG